MTEKEFLKEKKRRDVMNEFYTCPCGAKFIGKNKDFDNHLQIDCPIFKEELKKLSPDS